MSACYASIIVITAFSIRLYNLTVTIFLEIFSWVLASTELLLNFKKFNLLNLPAVYASPVEITYNVAKMIKIQWLFAMVIFNICNVAKRYSGKILSLQSFATVIFKICKGISKEHEDT